MRETPCSREIHFLSSFVFCSSFINSPPSNQALVPQKKMQSSPPRYPPLPTQYIYIHIICYDIFFIFILLAEHACSLFIVGVCHVGWGGVKQERSQIVSNSVPSCSYWQVAQKLSSILRTVSAWAPGWNNWCTCCNATPALSHWIWTVRLTNGGME